MVFVDGTNLFYRLESARLLVSRLYPIFARLCAPRKVLRVVVYSSQFHVDKAIKTHGSDLLDRCRLVLGDAVPTGDGNVKEKGVDSLLVADLIYHAATKNCSYACLVSSDTDFQYALKRVEDFGCKTAVVGIAAQLPPKLVAAADDYFFVSAEALVGEKYARRT